MRTDGRESDNIEDRRGEMSDDSGGGGGGFAIGGRHIGIGGIVIAIAASYFFGIDPRVVLGLMSGAPTQTAAPAQVQHAPGQAAPGRPAAAGPEDADTHLVRVVLADTEDTWGAVFSEAGQQYRRPTLVLFSGSTPTACGRGQASSGPFYCPEDEKVYLDEEFFRELRQRFQAPGEFAEAYVVAHEVGHHVQKLVGTMQKADALRARMSETQYNQVSVRLELQADCYAGIWAHRAQQARHILDQGDLEAALRAAAAIGDDTLQKRARGYAVPESFTHGTSEQRVRWFRAGYDSGQIKDCDTFAGSGI